MVLGILSSLLILFGAIAGSVHGHELIGDTQEPFAAVESEGSGGERAPQDLFDCQFCELAGRDEIDDIVLSQGFFLRLERERLPSRCETVVAPNVPACGNHSPRAPPSFSV